MCNCDCGLSRQERDRDVRAATLQEVADRLMTPGAWNWKRLGYAPTTIKTYETLFRKIGRMILKEML